MRTRAAWPPAPAAAPAAIGRGELALWMAALLALSVVRVARAGGPEFLNDSYQYLSMVDGLREHGALVTSIAHFDTERARLRLPAPETTFPPGYPLAIWALGFTGLPAEHLGLALSLLGALAVLPLLRAGAAALRLPPGAARLALLAWAASAQASLYAAMLYAEASFTAVSLGGLVLLLGRARDPVERPWRLPAAALLVALAYVVRYAGLFYLVALHAAAALEVARGRASGRRWALSLAAADAVVAAFMARNVIVAGTWMGGNTRTVSHGASDVLHRLGVGAWELAVGSVQRRPPILLLGFAALLLAGAVGVGASATRAALRRGGRDLQAPGPGPTLLLLCAAVYVAGMCYLGFTSPVSLGARMFVPLVPVLGLLAGRALAWAGWLPVPRRSAGRAFAAAAAAGYVGANAVSLLQPAPVVHHQGVEARLARPTPSGESLARWIAVNVPRDAVLLAVDGQATGYVLRRRTVSAAGRDFSALTWDEGEVRRTMAQFGARFLVLYPEVVESGGVDRLDSELFRRLAARRPPAWLELAAENGSALVFRAAERPGAAVEGAAPEARARRAP